MSEPSCCAIQPLLTGRTKAVDVLLVCAIGLLVNCARLGEGPLAGTEGHRALVAHQMRKAAIGCCPGCTTSFISPSRRCIIGFWRAWKS